MAGGADQVPRHHHGLMATPARANAAVVPAFRRGSAQSSERWVAVDGGADDGAGRFVQLRHAEHRDVALLLARVRGTAGCTRVCRGRALRSLVVDRCRFTATLVDIAPDLTGAVIASATGRVAGDAQPIAFDLDAVDHALTIGHRPRRRGRGQSRGLGCAAGLPRTDRPAASPSRFRSWGRAPA